ncbi:MAG: phosphatidylglycerophosphatase A [Bdellovibrionaceae bacterium]|nr:phosphatidylglycerophosphatase A [Pseudobdellovibrionaceae bacterium]
MKFLVSFATLFGVGRLPWAPGTWGTLATLPLAALLMWAGPFYHMGVCVFLLPVTVWAAEAYERFHDTHDASAIVVDEVIGFLITMVWLPLTWQSLLLGFVLFRLLDVTKPFPIGYLDRKVPGGVGVIVDDVLAGIIANLVLQIIFTKTAWLGIQSLGGVS